MFHMNEEDVDNIVKEKDDTIIELKNIIRKMEEDMEKLKKGMIVEYKDSVAQINKNENGDTNGEISGDSKIETLNMNGNGTED